MNEDFIIALASLHQRMFAELQSEVEELGGVVEEFEPADRIISIKVDPEYREYLEGIVATVVEKYEKMRIEILERDVFCGVKFILDDIADDE